MLLWCAAYTNWWIYNNLTLKIKKEIQIKETSAGCTEVSFICQNISKYVKYSLLFYIFIITLRMQK